MDFNDPMPGTVITQNTPTKAYREQHGKVELDTSSPEAYAAALLKYADGVTNAWSFYYGGNAPGYSESNAYKLQEAIQFWNYNHVGEAVGYYTVSSPSTPVPVSGNTYGTGENQVAAYAPNDSTGNATYEVPQAFYDGAVYASNVSSGELPRAAMAGDRTAGSEVIGVDINGLYSAEYKAGSEYCSTHRHPLTPYEWNGEYAAGRKNRY